MSEVVAHPAVPSAECPRCGYDQRGVMATWREQGACSLEGTCAECGLAFEWSELLSPIRVLPQWCAEAEQPARRWPGQFARTSARTWWPAALWRPLRMSHPHRWSRQVAFVLTWMAMMALTFLTCTGFLSLISWHSNMSPPNPRHGATTGPTAVFIHAFLQPWSSVPAGSYTVLPVGPYSSGWVAYNDYLPPRAHSQFLVTYWLQFGAMLLSPWLIAIAFAALPIARRRAKVRWRHLGRAAAYSYAIVVPLIMLFTLQRAATHNAFYRGTAGAPIVKWFVALIGRLLSIPLPLALSIAMIMLTGYWWLCIRLHLQMQRSWAVAIVVVTIGMLAAASIAFLER